MRLALDTDPRINLVRRYDNGELLIGSQLITVPCLVGPERLIPGWGIGSFAELSTASTAQLEPLLNFGAEIVLVGSGTAQPFPSATLRTLFSERRIALECMNLGAACRTYNILANEQRSVVAALFP